MRQRDGDGGGERAAGAQHGGGRRRQREGDGRGGAREQLLDARAQAGVLRGRARVEAVVAAAERGGLGDGGRLAGRGRAGRAEGEGGADGALGVREGGGGEGRVEVVFDRVGEQGREGVAPEVLEVVAAGEGDAFAWRGRQLDDPGEAEFEWEGDVRAVVFGEGSDFFPGEVE